VEFDAEHRPLVSIRRIRNLRVPAVFSLRYDDRKEAGMGRGILLWLLGVPIPVIILLWLFLR